MKINTNNKWIEKPSPKSMRTGTGWFGEMNKIYIYNREYAAMTREVNTEWGKVIHTMAYSTNLYSYNLMNLVSPSILMNYKPITAMETCFLMVWLVSVMVGCVMFAISIWFNRTVSIVVVLMLSLLGLSEGLFFTQRWLPFLSIFTWYRISVYGETIFMDWQYPKQYVYVILIICIMCLSFFAAYRRIRHTEFDWINET